jgi:hypothetical protein
MIVAVVAMRVMQPALYQVVDVIAMRDLGMAAAIVAAGTCNRHAVRGICFPHGDYVFIIMPVVRVVQVALMEVIHMVLVGDPQVTTGLAVLVGMIFMDMVRHFSTSASSSYPGRMIADRDTGSSTSLLHSLDQPPGDVKVVTREQFEC